MTSQAAYSFTVESSLPSASDLTPQLLDHPILSDISKVVDDGAKIFAFPKPSLADLKAQKAAEKAAHRERSMKGPTTKGQTHGVAVASDAQSLDKRQWAWPYSPATFKKWDAPADLPRPIESSPPRDEDHRATAPLSNYILSPAAEPVTPCPVESLQPMIQWLNKNEDFDPTQEPRVDFTKGSILGKTTRGGGVSVDLCKQVVGALGIGPIMDAVANNDNIDRFLLGNNIVTDRGAEVIADFIKNDHQKPSGGRIYNYYVSTLSTSQQDCGLTLRCSWQGIQFQRAGSSTYQRPSSITRS